MIENVDKAKTSGVIAVEGTTVVFKRSFMVEAPMAAARLDGLVDVERPGSVARMLELGAEAMNAYQTNATVRLLEGRLEGLDAQLQQKLSGILQKDRESAKAELNRLLREHAVETTRIMMRFTDTKSADGVPAMMTAKLQEVTTTALKQVDTMLQDGEQGALAKQTTEILTAFKDGMAMIAKQVLAHQTLVTKSALRGRPFEEALTIRLAELVRPLGSQVERVGDTFGVKKRRVGDHIITLDPALSHGQVVRIVIEAKTRANARFSCQAVREACGLARANREAAAAIFVAESAEILPDGLAFGQVGPTDFFVVFSPEAVDDVGLTAALYLARLAAVETVAPPAGESIDFGAAQEVVSEVRELLERFGKLEGYHSAAEKALGGARIVADDLRGNILAALRRLDGILAA